MFHHVPFLFSMPGAEAFPARFFLVPCVLASTPTLAMRFV